MRPIIHLEHVSKKFLLHRDRPRAFRDLFLGWRRAARSLPGQQKSELWAVQDVSFEIQPGETVGLIGPNGAGKSTTFKLISRIIPPTRGRVDVRGRVAALLELGTGFHPELSGRDNVFLSGALIGMGQAEMLRKYPTIVEFSELADFMDVPVKHYSSGMFARLAFAVSIHLDPEVLLVDEVLAVGDQAFQQKCLDRIALLQSAGVTICMVSHALDTVRRMCSRAIWFDHGRVLADGTAEAVVRQYLDNTTAQEAERLAGQTGPQADQRFGNRRIEIARVRLTDARGQESTVFETGQPLQLHLDYFANEPTPEPNFGMAIHRQDGLQVTGPNTAFSGLDFPMLEGEGTVTYSVPALPLLDGLYQISVAVVDRLTDETFDYHDRAYPFRVVNTQAAFRERYGVVTLGGQWQHQPAAQPAGSVAEPS